MELSRLDTTFIIAEIGINHDGSLNKLKKMIQVAKDCGADAVKLQVMTGYDLVAGDIDFHFGPNKEYKENLAQLFYSRRVKIEWLEDIYNYCEKVGIICLATPFSEATVDELETVHNPIYKISSGDITHLPLIEYISKKNKPIILSTGKSTLADIDEAVRTIKKYNHNFALLHCVSSYPTPYENLNLNLINTLKNTFKTTVGFSDHSEGYLSAVIAVSLGAKIVEKHFTLDKSSYGPDHWFSLNPEELRSLVKYIKLAEKTFGSGIKSIPDIEQEVYKRASRSVVASKKINQGEAFSAHNLTFKRPGVGIPPKHYDIILNKKANKAYIKDDPIKWSDL